MRRREFITLLGGAAAWPVAARAQQPERMRRIGVLMSTAADDPEGKARIAALLGGLQQLGWTDGRNAQIEVRWPRGDAEARQYATELVALAPDVILATGVYAGSLLQQETRIVPIVFVLVNDPVGAGFVASLARPGGNATGFSFVEYGVSGKWLELLKELAPGVTRAAVLRDATDPAGTGQWGAIQSVAPSRGVELTPIGVRNAGEIERGVAEFARSPNSGLIVTAGGPVIVHRERIIATAATHRLPAVYWNRMYPCRRRAGVLRTRDDRSVPPRRQLCRSHPQGREACRPTGAGAHQVRPRHQSQDREGARARNPIVSARPRRRGDRMRRERRMNPKCLGGSVPDTSSARSAHLTGLKMRRITRAVSIDRIAFETHQPGPRCRISNCKRSVSGHAGILQPV